MRNPRYLMLVLSILCAACGGSPAEDSGTTSEPTTEVTEPEYTEEKDGVYYYTSAVSENDQKDGKTSGAVLAFSYLGKNADGDEQVSIIEDDGSSSSIATCSNPCKIIHLSDGQKIQYTENSVIGSVFDDAIAGRLKARTTIKK